ncbi:MAG: hypothetical protein GC157_07200 [Frankiales bacterium]|nr:hypothetical protein [Frankiales bacterium]
MSDVVDFSPTTDDGRDVPITLADRIKSDIAARRRRVVTLTHPDAPRWAMKFRVPDDRAELAPFFDRENKAKKATKGRPSAFNLDAAILAYYNEGIRFEGEDLIDQASGAPLTVRDRGILDLLDVTSASEAIRAAYVSDGVVAAVSEWLLAEAGFGTSADVIADEDEEDPDPTTSG